MNEENPPAFPQHVATLAPGMTLRDYFAGQVITGLCSTCNSQGDWSFDLSCAVTAYALADALLEVRAKGAK